MKSLLIFKKEFWDKVLDKIFTTLLSVKVLVIASVFFFTLRMVELFTDLLSHKVITSDNYVSLVQTTLTSWGSVAGVIVGIRGVIEGMSIWGASKGPDTSGGDGGQDT